MPKNREYAETMMRDAVKVLSGDDENTESVRIEFGNVDQMANAMGFGDGDKLDMLTFMRLITVQIQIRTAMCWLFGCSTEEARHALDQGAQAQTKFLAAEMRERGFGNGE